MEKNVDNTINRGDPFEGEDIEQIAKEQKERLKSYIQSPIYRKLLEKEFLLQQQLFENCKGKIVKELRFNIKDKMNVGRNIITNKTETFVLDYTTRTIRDQRTNKVVACIYKSDECKTNTLSQQDIMKLYNIPESTGVKYFLSKLFKEYDQNYKKNTFDIAKEPSNVNADKKTHMKEEIDRVIQARLERLNGATIFVPSQDMPKLALGYYYGKEHELQYAEKPIDIKITQNGSVKPGSVVFDKNTFDNPYNADYRTLVLIPIHEYVHQMTDLDYGLLPTTHMILKKSAVTDDSYYARATEIHARMISIKYLAHRLGIINAFQEDFTEKHLEKLKQNPCTKNFLGLIELLEDTFPGQENVLISLMGLIAEIQRESNNSDNERIPV